MDAAFLTGLCAGIAAGGDPLKLLGEVLTHCVEMTGFACGAVYLASREGAPRLHDHVGFAECANGFFGDPELLVDIARRAGAAPMWLRSAAAEGTRGHAVLSRAGVSSMLVAPVFDDGRLFGMLVFGGEPLALGGGQEQLIGGVAAQIGRWLAQADSASVLSCSQRHIVARLTRAAEFRDEETANHTKRVSRYSALLARQCGLDARRSELIAAASTMHDIGKLGIPDSILRKAGPLSATERIHMQRHAEYGHRILVGESDPLLDLAATIALTHHERWDGAGYPYGVGGADIPLEGRIVAIVDVFDALTSDRVYRPAMSIDQALAHMGSGRGSQFDPDLLDMFVAALPQVLEIRRRHPDQVSEPLASIALS